KGRAGFVSLPTACWTRGKEWSKTYRVKVEQDRAKAYSRAKVRLAVISLGLELLVTGLLAFSAAGSELAHVASALSANAYVQFLVFVFLYGLVVAVPTTPVSFFSGYVLEHRYGLSNQNLLQWLVRQLKALAVSTLVGLPLGLLFYACLRTFGFWWWIPVGLAFFAVSVVLAQVAPVLILPLFYKFKPLERPELRERLDALLRKVGLQLEGLYEFDMSRETQKANAALTGLGKTRRILLGDTLLNSLSEDEIEAVVAHELGHHVHRHIWKTLVLGFLVELGGLGLAAAGHSAWVNAHGLDGLWDLRGLPFLFFLLVVYGQLVGPLLSAVSRKHEREADLFAFEVTGRPEAFASALRKLQSQNLEDPDPPRWVVWLFHDHPPISERVRAAESFAHRLEHERSVESEKLEPV
ncbi:MAG: M48 family metallopeptidase, partial [Calditrichaeota bacterium]|nr:M48 family metallopeptidase [Calditrichota bacterium]